VTSAYNPRLLLPPEEEEIYPYRRVWRSVAIEGTGVLIVALALHVIVNFVGVAIPAALHRPLNIGLALLPLGLWVVFSLLQERFVPQPRGRLLPVLAITALAANAIAIPLVNDVFQIDRWLPLSSAVARIIGYTFTVGIVQEFVKYTVVRYSVWTDCIRIRTDGLAYSIAAAVGYATVANLHYVFSSAATPDHAAMRIFDTVALHYAASLIVGYGLAEIRLGQPTPLLLAFTLALSATLTGIVIPIRAGLVNAGLSLGPAIANPLRGLGMSVVVFVGIAIAVAFLMENADRQTREAQREA
jgi:RsiW-degrading membrane proteinase PrsW (M82 family)